MEKIINLGAYTERYQNMIINMLKAMNFSIENLGNETYKIWYWDADSAKKDLFEEMLFFELF